LLSGGAIVIALIIWVFLPDDNEGWRPYTFDEELAALEAKYVIPDEENAATIYNQLLEDYNEAAFEPNFLDPNLEYLTRSEPWLSNDYPQAAEWLKTQQSTIETLMQASKIEKCRFPIAPDFATFNQSMKRLSAMRQWAFLLLRAANNDLGDCRIVQALEKQTAILQIAKHQFQQLTIPDMLTGIALEALAIGPFNRFIVTGDAIEERLSLIEKGLAEVKHDWASDFSRILEYERWSAKRAFANYYEVNPKGKIRLSRDPWAQARARWKKQLEANQIDNPRLIGILKSRVYLTYWQKKLIRARTILHWFILTSTPQKAGKIIDESFKKYYAMAGPDFDWEKTPEQISLKFKFDYTYLIERLAGMSEKAYYRIHDLYLRVLVYKRGSKILIGLRRYKNKNGVWPKYLDYMKDIVAAGTLIDPINNSSFVYKLTDDSFRLYSKGKNNIDEGGKRTGGPDDWLIWPVTKRETGGLDND